MDMLSFYVEMLAIAVLSMRGDSSRRYSYIRAKRCYFDLTDWVHSKHIHNTCICSTARDGESRWPWLVKS